METNPETVTEKDFVVDMPDMPLPSGKREEEIKDTFDGAFKFAFIGAGQGGSRIAESFWNAGYRKVVAINTADQDLAAVNLPDNRKLVIGGGGAGKVPNVAKAIFREKREDVLDLMRKGFGHDVDRVFVCVGAGGGTGGGCAESLVELAKEFMAAIGRDPKVGVIVALPKRAEGKTVCANAAVLLERLVRMTNTPQPVTISPLIMVDNERIDSLYPGLSVNAFWSTANKQRDQFVPSFQHHSCQRECLHFI